MILKHMGHSFFLLTSENGTVIAMDPYGDFYQYPPRHERADLCLISHHHHDHDSLQSLAGEPQIIDAAGRYATASGVRATGILTYHDDQNGALRGKNTFFVLEVDGLRVAHAGDLGHMPTPAQAKEIGKLDLLLLPVGGYYTINAKTALDVQKLLAPKVTIPMHYRTCYNPDMPIAPLAEYLALTGVHPQPMPLLRVTQADISELPAIVTLLPYMPVATA
ncbi:MAG: MBL fold metallo-hydrolase [Clostridia bacterium]